MLYSKTTNDAGGSGFHFSGDSSAPDDSFIVNESDINVAINLSVGYTYSFAESTEGEVFGKMTITAPTAGYLLEKAKESKMIELNSSYRLAIVAPISYTTIAGVTASFTQTSDDNVKLQTAISESSLNKEWILNLWLDANGNAIMPFVYDDLLGLALAMETADAPDFMQLLNKITTVKTATTIESVQSVTW